MRAQKSKDESPGYSVTNISPSCRAELGSAATSVQLQYVDPSASLHYVWIDIPTETCKREGTPSPHPHNTQRRRTARSGQRAGGMESNVEAQCDVSR